MIKLGPLNVATKHTLLYVYQQILILINPFIPFVSEYIFQKVSKEKLLNSKIKEIKKNFSENTNLIVEFLLLTLKSVRSFRQKHNVHNASNQINIYCELTQE